MMETVLDNYGDIQFRPVDMAKHVSYLLTSTPNRRFQEHMSFIFVIGNILQRRQTSYSAKVAVKRSWFPRVDYLLQKITPETIKQYTDKLAKNPFARPDNEGEKAASQLIRYVNYIGEHVPGSMAEVQNLRDELFSIVHTTGLPHVFLTLNPSDTNNPIAQVLAGRDIDLDKFFDELKPGSENVERSRAIAQNPVAGAQFFDKCAHNLIDILLGTRRQNHKGLFGEVTVYYGVVEAQGRGSLHIHMLLWLKNGLSPKEIQERRLSCPEWGNKLMDWYDDVFSQNIPLNTSEYVQTNGTYKCYPVMCRPPNPNSSDYWTKFDQDLRNILDSAGMIHEHNATCYKHLPVKLRALRNDDEDCRFHLPREISNKTHFDNDGYLVLRSNNGYVNGHNPFISVALRCNTDAKPIGGGTVAMAMFQYFGNYTAKHTMDTAFVFSALCSAIKILSDDPPMDIDGNLDTSERSRQLLIKTVNKLIGKRELSGQQVASKLIKIPSCYTNCKYPVIYWSGLLREVGKGIFEINEKDEPNLMDNFEDGGNELPTLDGDESGSYVVLTHQLITTRSIMSTLPSHSSAFNDIFFRPPQLANLCAWDLFCQYSKENLPESKNQQRVYLRLGQGHPQYATHCLKKVEEGVDTLRVPVLRGYPIPRSDRVDDRSKYMVAMLALFRPWSDEELSPVKDKHSTWEQAFSEWEKTESFRAHQHIMDNMQLLYETKDARLDYSALRRKRIHQLSSLHKVLDHEDDEYDINWIHAMQTPVDSDASSTDDTDFYDDSSPDILAIVDSTACHGFYDVNTNVTESMKDMYVNRTKVADDADREMVANFSKTIATCKKLLLEERTAAMNNALDRQKRHRNPTDIIPSPFTTDLSREVEHARQLYLKTTSDEKSWNTLEPCQQLAIMLIEKYSLNIRQILAFLLLIDTASRQWGSEQQQQPLRMLVTGPGGTGKSRLFEAWREFYEGHDRGHEFRLTAPTGVVASDIGGCTIHSEAALRVSRKRMAAVDAGGQRIRNELESRFAPMQTLVVDEIYFMSPGNISLLSEYCSLAKGNTEHPFGGLNLVTCGDPAQLPPPLDKPLFDRHLVHCYESSQLNALNEETQHNVKGIHAWYQVDQVVVLNEVMRQKDDPVLLDILSRLRMGTCTSLDKSLLDRHVLGNEQCSKETSDLPSIYRWVKHPSSACPLITYTNLARDAHNLRSAKAFAQATGQQFQLYHSIDTRGRGENKRSLKGIAAEAAWRIPVKTAKDLAGKLPLVPGMPVFCTENLATELGLSNGSRGTLISVTYDSYNDIRHAVSATVDFPGFKGPDTDHPHRVVLRVTEQSFKFRLPNADTLYSATRSQLPLIPAFAFTSHNSQGRSLDFACIDLASCRSIQSAYVMLSRVRSLNGLCILRPFHLNKIQNHISQELREEIVRTNELAKRTAAKNREKLEWYYSRFPAHIPLY